MKLETQREDLLGLLQNVIGVVERRQTLPILSNVVVEARDNQLTLTATDMEVEISAQAEFNIIEPGRTTLPARKLFDILRALPAEASVVLTVDESDTEAASGKAQLRAGRSRFALATLPADEMPTLDEFVSDSVTHLSRGDLHTLIERSHFAMAQQDVRYYLNGLLLEITAEGLRAVATDGHRLALCDMPTHNAESDQADQNKVMERQVIVPRKGVQELMRLLGDDDSPVKLAFGTHHIQVDLGCIRFTSKLIDGRFPDYQRAIPPEGEQSLVADRQSLRAALARVAILANENRGVRLNLEDWLLRIQANNPEQEEAIEEVEINYDGGNLEIGFNVSYLLDALGAIDEELVQIFLRDATSSCLIRAAEDASSRYVVSPMRL